MLNRYQPLIPMDCISALYLSPPYRKEKARLPFFCSSFRASAASSGAK